jgi:hypothetical protein
MTCGAASLDWTPADRLLDETLQEQSLILAINKAQKTDFALDQNAKITVMIFRSVNVFFSAR